eukprot:TRINITY_DN33680_c0_g1_i1.p1 TRINITY_DN33680_c0_g1~~TRINITY_DN33680_c0_g1_i1.p1  ORF type:complete len:120 (-),score=22.21 TRINITY_DN33680_c0_g1_i1:69-428(-)
MRLLCRLLFIFLLPAALGQDGGMVHTFFKIFHSLISPHGDFEDIIRMKDQFIQEKQTKTTYDPDSLPYFKIFPKYMTTLAPGTTEDILGTCFESMGALRATQQWQCGRMNSCIFVSPML